MVMRLIRKIKRFFFGIQEITWWFVAELEDWLYPYRDREVTNPLWAETYNDVEVDEVAYLKSQMQSANERIERLQSEMIHAFNKISELNNGKE